MAIAERLLEVFSRLEPILEDSSAELRERMAARLKREHSLSDYVADAFRTVRRELFVPQEHRYAAYEDVALPLADGSTISQPSMLAIMLSEMKPEPGLSAFEVGSGSGYFLALLCALDITPYGAEIRGDLAERSRRSLEESHCDATVFEGRAQDVLHVRTYDRVVFSAAAKEVPAWAMELLSPEGFVLAPVGNSAGQELQRVFSHRVERTGQFCRFVPFLDAD